VANYSFKKDVKVYIVFTNVQYSIDVSDIDFSQTFIENSFPMKTIQSSEFFEGSVINKANPANFSLSIPLIRESDFTVVFNRLIDYKVFDLYIDTQQVIFKITKCVITSGTFVIERSKELRLNITGEASKLELGGDSGIYTIPGSIRVRAPTISYNLLKNIVLELNTEDISEGLYSLSIQLQNNIEWVSNKFIQGACPISDLVFPENFKLVSRVLSGSVSRFLTEDNNKLQTTSTNSRITIEAGQKISGDFSGIKLLNALCSYTNRLSTGSVFLETYDWRFIDDNPNLSGLLTYIVTGIASGAILDFLNEPILDSSNEVILEN